MDVGAALREARRRAGQSQAEAAARVGVTQSTISKWELGATVPSRASAARLRAIGVDVPDVRMRRRRVSLGPSLVRMMHARRRRGESLSAVIVRLVAAVEGEPPLRWDRYMVEGSDGGVVDVRAARSWWARVDRRSRVYGESVSESVRALLHAAFVL